MDVQTENTDPPPCESQPSGKIRKGFKLFGKHKPGKIFSIRSKSEGNNKSPVNRSKTLDGAPEPAAPDSEHEAEKDKGQALNHGDGEQTEEEPLGEDGVLAAAPARTSISSASSAKSLGFLSILRGGRRGVGDRRVHTVSQPVGRQRRGIKGLFGNVKFRSKDKDEKEEKEDIPPSPLLMSSRSNSVEIIKEDLTLTPKSQPRSLDSPETESSEPTKSFSTQDSSSTSPSKTVTVGNVSKSNEPLPTSQAAMVPGETSLSSLLADISSLLTFDSISGGGDIMADVEAEWGKASSAMSAVASDSSPSYTSPFSKPSVSSPLTTSSISTAKPPPSSLLTTASAPPPSTITSSPSKPSSIITTLTKSSTLTTQTVKSTSGLSSEQATRVTTQSVSTKPSTTPLTNISAPIMSSPPITMKTLGFTSPTTAPPNTPAAPVKAPSASPTLTSTVTKLASEMTETPKTSASVIKPSPVAAPPPALAKTTPVMHSPPTPAAFTQPSATKQDLASSFQAASSNKAPVTVSVTSTVTTSPPAPLISSKVTTTEVTSAPVSVSATISKPAPTSCSADLNKASPSIVHELSSSTAVTSTKPQPSFVSAPSSTLTSVSRAPPTTTPVTAPVSLHETPPAPKMPPAVTPLPSQSIPTHVSQVSPASVAPSASKEAPFSVSQAKVSLAPADTPLPASKTPISASQIPASSPQIPPAFTQPALSQFTPASCPVSSPPLSTEGLAKKRESGQGSVDGHLTSPKSPEARDVPQQDTQQIKEDKKRTSQGNTTGLSKIPVVGGGRVGKIPVRVSQHTEEEANRDVPMSAPEEASPHFNSHDIGSKDKIGNSDAAVATSKHGPEDSPQLPQPKASTCLPRDSKIPVKHGSQIPQAKDPARTKIPVSKVPVRRAGTKPTAPSGSTQIRK